LRNIVQSACIGYVGRHLLLVGVPLLGVNWLVVVVAELLVGELLLLGV
jgi:hypothetical protein